MFFSLITGSLNYIIEDKKIPRYQREMLKKRSVNIIHILGIIKVIF
ncbi:hypothetical protein BACPU_15610 [Bacillus pumilus]|nr:hypothetical protein BACPU_15610 [Bacillus pumilus]